MPKSLGVIFFLCMCGVVSSAQVNLTSGLVAYYPFNGTFNDASGNGNHGTGMNGVTYGTDQWGNTNNAAFFDGVNDWINVGIPSFTFGHRFSIAFRFKTNTPRHQCIMSKSNYSGAPTNFQFQVAFNHPIHNPKGLYLGTNHNGTCLYGPSGDFDHFGTTSELLPTNQWGCAVITFNNGVKSIYLNGSLKLQTTVTTGAFPTTVDSCPSSTFRIGAWWQSDPRYFSGMLDEVRLYNRALNAQEIDSLCHLITLPKDTVINKYAAVTDRGKCDNSFFVDTATGFAAGDTVLMIQMKGADIDTGNNASFGSVVNYNGAGNYELNVIKAVSGNSIILRYKLQRQYDIPGGRVQFVRVPSYTNYTVTQKHSCLPWTGSKGGVFVIDVANTLSLNADIDVSGKGFTGGQINNGTTFSCDKPDYFYPLSGNDGGSKGEGIAEISGLMMRGKGKLANGGGGGNNTNGGGGGGGNGGSGGAGARQFANCNQSLSSGGLGGAAMAYSALNNRLYLGGGGGCGHENNANTDPGGNGAGIIMINAGTLAGNGNYIKANGLNCVDNYALATNNIYGDGQSGGGAGGAVLLKVASFTAAPIIEAKGGNGGNIYASALHGPGGGGGGGSILFGGATLSGTNINTSGGANGTVTKSGNTAHNAQPGQAGVSISGISFSMPVNIFLPNQITIGFTDTVVTCISRQFISKVTTTSVGIASYHWSSGSMTSSLRNPVFTFPGIGTYTVKLVVIDSNGCKDSLIKNVLIDYLRFAHAQGDTGICLGKSALLTATGGGQYAWSPAATLDDSTGAVAKATPLATTSYVVTVTDKDGCIDRDTVTVSIIPSPIPITAYPSDTAICNGKQLQLMAINGTSYQWSPATGLNNANIAAPMATFTGNIRYIVSGTDLAGCLSSDTINIRRAPDPVVHAGSDGTAISCDHAGVMLYASGAHTYTWSPAMYVNDSRSATPIASPLHTMVFTVTGYDSIGCMGSDTITVFAYAKAAVFMPDAFTPNGDGRNDRIRPIAYCDFNLAEFRIFNRWGQAVFYGFSNTQSWDGQFGGKPAPIGVYGYFVRGTAPSTGKEVIYKGNFTLIR